MALSSVVGWGLGTEGSSQLWITVFGWRLTQYKSVDSKQNFRSSPTHSLTPGRGSYGRRWIGTLGSHRPPDWFCLVLFGFDTGSFTR